MTRDEMDRAAAWLRDTADEYEQFDAAPNEHTRALRIAADELDAAMASDECEGPPSHDPRQISIPGIGVGAP